MRAVVVERASNAAGQLETPMAQPTQSKPRRDREFGLKIPLAHKALTKANKWTHWHLNPGRSACGAEAVPLGQMLAYLWGP
jgi:hypothetical protein